MQVVQRSNYGAINLIKVDSFQRVTAKEAYKVAVFFTGMFNFTLGERNSKCSHIKTLQLHQSAAVMTIKPRN